MGDIELRVQEELAETFAGEPRSFDEQFDSRDVRVVRLELEVTEDCDGMEMEDPVVDSADQGRDLR